MKLTESQLKKLIEEELEEMLNEQSEEQWNELFNKYYKCRIKATKGRAAQLVARRVRSHIAKAKTLKNGYKKLVDHINAKYPGCV